MPKGPTVGLFIRDYLLEHGPSSAHDIWKAWKEIRKKAGRKAPTYQSFYHNYIWRLKQMGLIREVGRIRKGGGFKRVVVLLDVVPERINDPAWLSVQGFYAEYRGYGTKGKD